MERLVDYFAVVGHDFDATEGKGKVVTRIPEQDWKDEPFIQGIELFCQPSGWFLTKERQPPKFFVCVLTDAFGKKHYCAVLSFSECSVDDATAPDSNKMTPAKEPKKAGAGGNAHSPTHGGYSEDFVVEESMCQVDVDHESRSSTKNTGYQNEKTVDEYSTKCLVLISRHQEFNVLKNCLSLIYTVYIEDLSVSLETVVANLLVVNVPPRGTSIYRFSIGAADKQALQPPQYEELPVTMSSVAMLLRQLGILNVMNVLCAALVDHKLLFYSCSFTRLTESCNALTALMFPFSYSYPYIPILPHNLLECTASPTPFMIGVHSSFKSDLHDLIDVITVDLDGGVISVPDCISVPCIPEPYYTNAVELLTKVLCPDLVMADYAYPPEQINTSEPEKLDKEIRAIFLRLFCQLLMGYRSCLQVCRIHPHPVIRFQKDMFLDAREYRANDSGLSPDFMPKLVESQAFSLFIQEEGLPYRRLTIFDRVVAEMPERMRKEGSDINKALRHVKDIAYELYRNEHPNAIHPTQRVPKPSETAYLRPKRVKFPKISPTAVQTFMADTKNLKNEFDNSKPIERPSIRVPDGSPVGAFSRRYGVLATSSRRLEVLRNCVQFIFENRTLETKKIFHAVLRALKSSVARDALIQELKAYATVKPQLDNQQFDYIARLCNCALEDCSGGTDEYKVSANMLPVLSSFYRKLCPTVMQFLYTVVQDHEVWTSVGFWEFTFFSDIETEMCRLYYSKKSGRSVASSEDDTKYALSLKSLAISPTPMRQNNSTSNLDVGNTVNAIEANNPRNDLSCLEIASTELRDLLIKSDKEKQELASSEEGVVVGQIQHVSQRMVFMLVPMDCSEGASYIKYLRNAGGINEDSSNSYFTSSLAGSVTGSIDEDDGFNNQQDTADVTGAITKFVSMFVDKTCSETGISADFSKSLLAKVPNLVLMQHESLHDVYKESKRLPPIKKPKLLEPKMLPGEYRHEEHTLRAYLSDDGRLVTSGGTSGGPALLPAEGAVFLTNYRLIFIGIPCDPLASDQVVIRSFPVSGLFKVKFFVDSDRIRSKNLDAPIQHWASLYSSTFQLLVIGLDEEDVSEEQRLAFGQFLHSLRNPSTIDGVFAIQAGLTAARAQTRPKIGEKDGVTVHGPKSHSDKTKAKGYGAKTLMKQAKKKAGMTLGKQSRFSRLVMNDSKTKTLYLAPVSGENSSYPGRTNAVEASGRMSAMDETLTKTLTDKGTVDQLSRRACREDYARVKLLGQASDQFRLTSVNRLFSVCRSYPVCVLVPRCISDENVKYLSHCHHQNRFPCITWKHPATMAILCRSGAIKSRTATSLFKHGHSTQSLSDDGIVGSSAEEERFLLALVEAADTLCPDKSSKRESTIFKFSSSDAKSTIGRGNNGYASSFRESRIESSSVKPVRKWGTLSRTTGKSDADYAAIGNRDGARSHSDRPGNGTFRMSTILGPNFSFVEKAKLYVFVEKTQGKSFRPEQQGRVQFVAVDLPDPKQVRSAFKTLLKGTIPVQLPTVSESSPPSLDDAQLYRKAVDDSGWLQQISTLLTVSGAIVDLMDVQGASVLISLEDGWDCTLQLSSLAQLMLDPYYRTIEGFQTLVQKEWLSSGHRFSHRNHFNENISSGFTPLFLQFLDCVHQILQQFPLAFEFNSMYLQTLAYHSVSNRFDTFVLDSEFERLEAGILCAKLKTRSGRKLSLAEAKTDCISPTKSPRTSKSMIKSLWDYIESTHQQSPVFYNSLYSPGSGMQVLRPVTTLGCMRIWPYYNKESLGDCPAYDGLLGELSTGARPNEQEATEVSDAWGGQSGRRIISFCYDGISHVQPDVVRSLIQQVEHLRVELDEPAESWHDLLKSAASRVALRKQKIYQPKEYAREQIKLQHKRLTMDVVLKSSSKDDISGDSTSLAGEIGTIRHMDDNAWDTASMYRFQQSSSETRTYESILWKRGAYMKSWKQRFFVLDSTKHQLRQYESKMDKFCKSIYDLKEVESVRLIDRISGAPKGVGDQSFFEVKTAKRSYHFIAENDEAAGKWIDALQSALHG